MHQRDFTPGKSDWQAYFCFLLSPISVITLFLVVINKDGDSIETKETTETKQDGVEDPTYEMHKNKDFGRIGEKGYLFYYCGIGVGRQILRQKTWVSFGGPG